MSRRAKSLHGGTGGPRIASSSSTHLFSSSGAAIGSGLSAGFGAESRPLLLGGGSSTDRIGFAGFDVNSGFLAGLGSFFEGSGAGSNFGAGNGKATMQNLNDRLAAYLEKVHSLEITNGQLEQKIRDWHSSSFGGQAKDYSPYFMTISELQDKIFAVSMDNSRILMQIDNTKLATNDFHVKYENELAMRKSVEADIAGLRKLLDEMTLVRADLEMQIEGLKEELIYLKNNHKEEMKSLCSSMSGSVNVEVDAAPQEDLAKVLEDMRAQYETIAAKNQRDMENWYKNKFDDLTKQVTMETEALQTSKTEIGSLKKTLHTLEIELQSLLSIKAALDKTLAETNDQYGAQLFQLQDVINRLEGELVQVRQDMERQGNEYKMLLNVKTRLEMEIAEYRRLLEGEHMGKSSTGGTEGEDGFESRQAGAGLGSEGAKGGFGSGGAQDDLRSGKAGTEGEKGGFGSGGARDDLRSG
ncbi:keratin, type I cytoskeletal 19-like, partial [Polypterus senegalus]|uniref:keratin, type I cytoskeletal 19-like n=1 Tax=Polypterus senegalus TaxID=55291 RepID=UPI001962C563